MFHVYVFVCFWYVDVCLMCMCVYCVGHVPEMNLMMMILCDGIKYCMHCVIQFATLSVSVTVLGSACEITYIVSGGALNSTHSLSTVWVK